MFQRPHFQVLANRLQEPRRFIQVITGPRQVGKTTLVQQVSSTLTIPFLFVSADAVSMGSNSWLKQQWDTARVKMEQLQAAEFVLIIDEIQKINQWSETVKLLWDEDTSTQCNIKLILLGSSRLLIQKGLTESLAGRFEMIYMGHWSFLEMKNAFGFSVDDFCWYGGYPGAVPLIGDEARWKDYLLNALIETSISKDILMLTRIDKPALMKKLFELGCLYSGQILSYTKMIGQLQDAGNTTTLSHYLNLLHSAGLLAGIEKYAGDIIRKRSSSPKFQVHNTALISAQIHKTKNECIAEPAFWGKMVESAVGAHLINATINRKMNLFYWREKNEEVDFILEKNGDLIALEVKSSFGTSTKGMNTLSNLYPIKKILLIGDTGISINEFLQINPDELF
jgi:predicted AAA+ superfamily ATPase